MKRVITILITSAALFISGLASAESPHEFSANVALSTDYMYRGQSQTGNDPSISGGLDYGHSSGLYVGTWASNVNFPNNVTSEIDIYGGFANEFGSTGISYDLGVLYYIYPGSPEGADNNFVEGYAGLGYDFTDYLSAGVTFRATPDWQGATGEAFNVEGTIDITLPYEFTLSGMVGHQTVDENATWGSPDWTYYSIGLSKTLIGPFDVGVAWIDTDLNNTECFGSNICEGRAVFTISSSF